MPQTIVILESYLASLVSHRVQDVLVLSGARQFCVQSCIRSSSTTINHSKMTLDHPIDGIPYSQDLKKLLKRPWLWWWKNFRIRRAQDLKTKAKNKIPMLFPNNWQILTEPWMTREWGSCLIKDPLLVRNLHSSGYRDQLWYKKRFRVLRAQDLLKRPWLWYKKSFRIWLSFCLCHRRNQKVSKRYSKNH